MIRKRAALLLLATTALYLAFFYLVPHIHVNPKTQPKLFGAVVVLTTLIFMGIQIAVVRWMAETRIPLKWAVPAFVLSFALFAVAFILIANSQHDRLLHLLRDQKVIAQLRAQRPGFQYYSMWYSTYHGKLVPLVTLLMISSATLLGYIVSFILRERNIVLPVAAVAAIVDFWTVNAGPTSKVLKNAPGVVEAVSARIPSPGAGHLQPISFIGPGDFIFLAILFGAICRLGMNARRTYWFVFPLMSLGMLSVLFGLVGGFPALVLVGLGVVAANFGQFKLSKNEVRAVVVVIVLLAATALVLTPILTRKP
jgi:hypothetical protein